MLPSSHRLLLRLNRLCAVFGRRFCDQTAECPEYLERWELKEEICKLTERSAKLIRSCIEKNRRYKNSIVMETYGSEEIFLHTKKKLDLACLTQDATKQDLYRKMNHTKNKVKTDIPLAVYEYYKNAMGIKQLRKSDSLMIVGIADRISIKPLPRLLLQQTGMPILKKLELFLLMAPDDVIKIMKRKHVQEYQVMLQSFFEIKCLMRIQAASIIPKMKPFRKAADSALKQEKIRIQDRYVNAGSRDHVYLMHLVIDEVFGLEEFFFEFRAFLDIFRSQNKYLIRTLENYFPGSGLPLLEADYTMVQKVKDLTSEQFLEIFMLVRKMENYKDLSLMLYQ
ncbi:uncharacterized protein LOC132562932 [Ylistrum balloti]|uniref:uncharacterized protein LOC132562932 n=1 Tax=Ylistrum balloti TaxID=509963 RepID=UPI002905E230|nr:uncharacterized protein LOC132562932 [Ylistrum balloti]